MAYVGRDFDVTDFGENQPYALDFINDLASGESLTGTPTVTLTVAEGIDPSPNSHLVGMGAISGTQVIQRISGMVAGTNYIFEIQCSTTASNTKSLWTHLRCRIPQ